MSSDKSSSSPNISQSNSRQRVGERRAHKARRCARCGTLRDGTVIECDNSCLSISTYLTKNSGWANVTTYYPGKVTELRYYPNGVAVVKRKRYGVSKTDGVGRRAEISYLSYKSRRRMFLYCAGSGVDWLSMLTLTFPINYPTNGQLVKTMLDRFLKSYRREVSSTYFWFLEFQRRGAPHIHLFSTVKVSKAFRGWFGEEWARLCERWLDIDEETRERVYRVHSHYRQWSNVREKNGAIRYAAKYAHKTNQKVVPRGYRNVGRFWGASRDVKPKLLESVAIDEERLRLMLDVLGHPVADYELIPKYIYGLPYEDLTGPR